MSPNPSTRMPFVDDDILVVTSAGERQLKDSETSASRLELELMVLVNGISTVAQIRSRADRASADEVHSALRSLIEKKMIGLAPNTAAFGGLGPGDFLSTSTFYASSAAAAKGSTGASKEDEKEANEGIGYLQSQGYYVRIARRPPVERKPGAGGRFSVVIVEDEPQLSKLLQAFFSIEGFETRTAANRAEILDALRKPPIPDLILLDVVLPDADGFEILARLRQYPAFKDVAIIMLTAKTTRESVLKGLSGGADGYVTKPFDMDVLMKAVTSVFGMAQR
jgi:two-component system OmpR family response regulator